MVLVYTMMFMNMQELFDQAEKLRSEELYDEAVERYKEVVSASSSDSFIKGESFHMLGLIFSLQKKFELAYHYLREAEEVFTRLEDSAMRAAVLRDQSDLSVAENNLDKAEGLLLQSVQLLEGSEKRGHLGISKVKLGCLYQRKGMMADAEKAMLEGIGDIKQSDDRYFESSAYFSLAKLQKEQHQIAVARVSAEHALSVLKRTAPANHHLQRKEEIEQFIDNLV